MACLGIRGRPFVRGAQRQEEPLLSSARTASDGPDEFVHPGAHVDACQEHNPFRLPGAHVYRPSPGGRVGVHHLGEGEAGPPLQEHEDVHVDHDTGSYLRLRGHLPRDWPWVGPFLVHRGPHYDRCALDVGQVAVRVVSQEQDAHEAARERAALLRVSQAEEAPLQALPSSPAPHAGRHLRLWPAGHRLPRHGPRRNEGLVHVDGVDLSIADLFAYDVFV
mmetsp:Transcript_17695/g.47226  ORF Transcript_17695/g.47226 Transcript_17695/m.47226 type:complete len:220 (-) Transcript_17695:2627-3286(-)